MAATYSVDNNSREDGAGDGLAVLGIVDAPAKLLVTSPVQAGDDTEDNNRKDGQDGAIEGERSAIPWCARWLVDEGGRGISEGFREGRDQP